MKITTQDNTIRNNYVKAKIDNMQQDSECWLCGDGEETVNHTICECSKQAQKECKTRHDWEGTVIKWELSKR